MLVGMRGDKVAWNTVKYPSKTTKKRLCAIPFLDTYSHRLQVHSGRDGAGIEYRVLHMSGDL